ncbi:DNA-damage-inducible protein J [Bartonella australis AUST/NH1]|uniref:DNA-damage-inducible protein J n=1 Tax=Bartonella australis (strain Aust/NH1) TaxID=1094489 RepID=M1NXC8_BARAA|nr:type II toxin-antitoxin system RelB/DinJ family antitoxin [Bartonella australis]AGF74127.1 DNA-damage-inducible protein J [Bartonella australis AUST/NH1]
MVKIQARVPDEVQKVASAIIKSTGLTVSDAVRMFMTRIATDKALPLDLFQPSPETLQAIEESKAGKLTPTTIDGIMADIEKAQSED